MLQANFCSAKLSRSMLKKRGVGAWGSGWMNRNNVRLAIFSLPFLMAGFIVFLWLYYVYRVDIFSHASLVFLALFVFVLWFLVAMPVAGRFLYSKFMTENQRSHLRRSAVFRFLLGLDKFEAKQGEKDGN